MRALSNHLLSAILLTPLAGALVILLVNGSRAGAIRWIAHAFAALAVLLALPLWFLYQPHGKTWQFAERGEWIPRIGASYFVGVDGASILLILLTALMTWVAIVSSWSEVRERVKAFYACLLIVEGGLLGVFMSLDFLLFFVFWQVVLVAMYCLIRAWGGGRRLRSALRFSIHTFAASVVLMGGILTLYFFDHGATGEYSFDITRFQTLSVPVALQQWVFVAFLAGFAVLVPLVPLHTWLPDTQTDGPAAGSIVVAAVLLKMGTYGILRFSLPILPDASRLFAPVLVTLAIVGIVYGALNALAQSDAKRLVAWSSVSQMAFITLGTFALTPVGVTGSVVQQIYHGIVVGALVLIVGIMSHSSHTGEIATSRGPWAARPLVATIVFIVAMLWIGLPALNGFRAEVLIPQGAAINRLRAGAAVVGMALGLASMARLFWPAMFGAVTGPAVPSRRDLAPREVAVLVSLAALGIWIALHPAPLQRRLETSVGRVIARVNPAYAPYLALGSDCATPAPPEPSGPPPEFLLTAPCADGSDPATKPPVPDGTSR